MPRTLKSVDQLAIDEQAIEDDEVLTALESYQNSKEEARATAAVARTEKAAATALLDRLDIQVGTAARIGRFRITREETKARSVQFETAASERIRIALVLDD